jgi:hypothetical protein
MKPGVAFHVLVRLKVWESVRSESPHSQVNPHFRNSSPHGFPNLQEAIIKVKTHGIEELFISLERSWNLNV